jgi:ElaB/YqjD/DUF883 family membrane-anchored ribosome-binding protein
MSATIDTDADLDEIRRDLSDLKRDVASLIEDFKDETKSGVQDASNQITDTVRRAYETAAANGEQIAKAIGPWIERRPFLSLGVAFGAGYFGACALAPRAGPALRTNSPDSRSPRLNQGSLR